MFEQFVKIQTGADPNAKMFNGWTPLHAGASVGNVDVSFLLLKIIRCTMKSFYISHRIIDHIIYDLVGL